MEDHPGSLNSLHGEVMHPASARYSLAETSHMVLSNLIERKTLKCR